jgi:phosphonate transport system substrate-binding protein
MTRPAVTLLVLLATLACAGPDGDDTGASTEPASPSAVERVVVTIGDIEPYEPAWRIERLAPLAQLLAERLEDGAPGAFGRVVIARDMAEMSRLMAEGKVDLLFDSPHPVLTVKSAVGGRILLQRDVLGRSEYASVFVCDADRKELELGGLDGRVVALQEPHSTSGFLLPAIELARTGFELREVPPEQTGVGAGEVGYYLTRDEENTLEAVISGRALAGAVSGQDLDQLPEDLRRRLRVFHRTSPAPRQLVLARSDLDAARVERVREILLALDDADRERLEREVEGGGWDWTFSEPSPDAMARLEEIELRASSWSGRDGSR